MHKSQKRRPFDAFMPCMSQSRGPAAWCGLLVVLFAGCLSSSPHEVVVYTALDSDFSRPIFDDFTRQTGIVVRPKFDTEATKTVGLYNEILAERDRPRCDVFWNNEILNSIRLADEGLVELYVSPAAASYPPEFRSSEGAWHGFAARARVLLVNTDLVPKNEWPTSIQDLLDPKWRGRVGIAKPLFGTTATHAACLFAHWGEQRAKKFFRQLKENALVLAGNKQVALAVGSGQLAFGLTDTDDAIIEVESGKPVAIVYPDRQPDQLGTLFIPNSLVIVKGGPHAEPARRLVDYLLSPQVEAKLAAGPSAQIPLHQDAKGEVRIETPRTVHAMPVDFQQAAQAWPAAARFLRDEFAAAR